MAPGRWNGFATPMTGGQGTILVCDVVYAELVPAFGDRNALEEALREIGAAISPINTAIAYQAGVRWLRYGLSRRATEPYYH